MHCEAWGVNECTARYSILSIRSYSTHSSVQQNALTAGTHARMHLFLEYVGHQQHSKRRVANDVVNHPLRSRMAADQRQRVCVPAI